MASITLATLLQIRIPGVATPLFYQNYQQANYVYNGDIYSFIGFHIQTYPTIDLAAGQGDTVILIRNTQVIRALLLQYNDLKRSIVTIIHTQPGTTVPAIAQRLVLSFVSTEGGTVGFVLRPMTSALSGALSTAYLTAQVFPAIPYYKPAV